MTSDQSMVKPGAGIRALVEIQPQMPEQTPPGTSFLYDPTRPLPTEIRRITLEQIDRAIWQLTVPREKRDLGVHDARKCFKKTRAVLRLVRDELGDESFERENGVYRDAARALSSLRSSAVMAETLDALQGRYSDQLPEGDLAHVRAGLMEMHEQAWHNMIGENDILSQVANIVKDSRERLKNLTLEKEDFSTLRLGLRRVYKRGYHTMSIAYTQPSPEHFHEWRKRVKYLRYGIRILRPLWENPIQTLAGELDTLSSLLGLEHDLVELANVLRANPGLIDNGSEDVLLHDYIELYRFELQLKAQALGMRIYAEKPKAFANRLSGYWDALQVELG